RDEPGQILRQVRRAAAIRGGGRHSAHNLIPREKEMPFGISFFDEKKRNLNRITQRKLRIIRAKVNGMAWRGGANFHHRKG
ncbi:MAG: hypothetical protein IJS55_07395, partial [Oscillospiraceae bacterium]|nr:hypothetical protein [Oscillospiraceae bacterium]